MRWERDNRSFGRGGMGFSIAILSLSGLSIIGLGGGGGGGGWWKEESRCWRSRVSRARAVMDGLICWDAPRETSTDLS